MPAPINLSEERQQDIKNMLRADRARAEEVRKNWTDRLRMWWNLYEGNISEVEGGPDGPWPNSANINLDLIPNAIDEFQARGMNALFGDQKWAAVAPVEGGDAKRWPIIEDFMQWALQTDIKAWPMLADVLLEIGVVGTAFIYDPWLHKRKKTLEPRFVRIDTIKDDPLFRATGRKRATDRDLIQAVFGEIQKSIKRSGDHYEVVLVEDGRRHTAKIWVDRKPDDREGEALLEIFREEVLEDHPAPRLMNSHDVYTTDNGDLQTAPFVGLQHRVTLDWLRRQKQRGKFNLVSEEDWEDLVQHATGAKSKDPAEVERGKASMSMRKPGPADSSGAEDAKDLSTGVESTNQPDRTRPYFEWFYSYDIDGDGFEEEVVFYYDWSMDILLGANYLDKDYAQGERPVVLVNYKRKPNRTYSTGLADKLFNSQIMANTGINMSFDAASLQVSPPWFFDQGSGLGDRGEIKLVPGKGTALQSGMPLQEQVFFPQLNLNPGAMMPIVDNIIEFSSARAGFASLLGGGNKKLGSGTGTPRTFGGTNVMLQDNLIRLEFDFKAAAVGFNRLFHQIWDQYGKLLPPKKKFRIMGPDGVRELEINRSDLRIKPDFMFSVDMLNANPAIRQQNALLMYQTTSPTVAQTGALDKLRNQMLHLHRAFGTPNPEDQVPEVPGMLKRAPMPQEMENELLLQGVPLDVLPVDDDMTHLVEMEEAEQVWASQGIQWMPQMLMEWERHKFGHIQQLEQKQQAGSRAANEGGRPMGTERRLPGQERQPRAAGGGLLG